MSKRLLVALAGVVVSGVVAGVLTGSALGGNTAPPRAHPQSSLGDLLAGFDRTPLAEPQDVPGTTSFPRSQPRDEAPRNIPAQNLKSTSLSKSIDGVRPFQEGGGLFQVSRQVASSLEVVPFGDADCDGAVGVDDLQIITRSLGSMTGEGPAVDCDAQPIVDWNGDGRVDVLDLAIAASNLGVGTDQGPAP